LNCLSSPSYAQTESIMQTCSPSDGTGGREDGGE
jgi:hypothetical protein